LQVNINDNINKFPKNLTHLILKSYYNHTINNLPENLIYLSFFEYLDELFDPQQINLNHNYYGYPFDESFIKYSL